MPSYNNVVLVGHMVKSADVRAGRSGTSFGEFAVGVNRRVKRDGAWDNQASFIDCKVFGKTADYIADFGGKGVLVLVQGELVQDRWEKDGQRRSKVLVYAQRVVLLDKRPESTDESDSEGKPRKESEPGTAAESTDEGGSQPPDDLPF